MPTDPSNPFEEAGDRAARKADQQTASELSRLSTSWEDIKKLLPKPEDQQKLEELMSIVRDATNHNAKVARLINNIGTLGDVVVKVMSRFA